MGLLDSLRRAKNHVEKAGFNLVMNIMSQGAWKSGKLSSFGDDDKSLFQVTSERLRGQAKLFTYGFFHPMRMPAVTVGSSLVMCADRYLNIDEDDIIDIVDKLYSGELTTDDVLEYIVNINYEIILPEYFHEYIAATRHLVEKIASGELTNEDIEEYAELMNQFSRKHSIGGFIHDSYEKVRSEFDEDDYDENECYDECYNDECYNNCGNYDEYVDDDIWYDDYEYDNNEDDEYK